MGLAAVRDLRSHLRLSDPDEVAAFELDLLSEYALARAAATIGDATIRRDLAVISEVREWLGRPMWEMRPQDMDRFLVDGQRGRDPGTKANKAHALAVFSSSWSCGMRPRSTQPPVMWCRHQLMR
jgi:integrase/recombinase XerD